MRNFCRWFDEIFKLNRDQRIVLGFMGRFLIFIGVYRLKFTIGLKFILHFVDSMRILKIRRLDFKNSSTLVD